MTACSWFTVSVAPGTVQIAIREKMNFFQLLLGCFTLLVALETIHMISDQNNNWLCMVDHLPALFQNLWGTLEMHGLVLRDMGYPGSNALASSGWSSSQYGGPSYLRHHLFVQGTPI